MVAMHGGPVLTNRGLITRKQFLRRSAAIAGGVAGFGLVGGSKAVAASSNGLGSARRNGDPKPIPGGFDGSFANVPSGALFHVFAPAIPYEMSSIGDFNGVVAATEIRGTATGSDNSAYWFDADMRVMKGAYVDVNGRLQEHAFGFI